MKAKQTETDLKFPGSLDGDLIPVPALGTSFTIGFSGTSAATTGTLAVETGLGQATILLRLTATFDCFVTSAASPTAVADGTHHYLSAGVPQDLRFPAAHKLAAISNGTDGNLYATALV